MALLLSAVIITVSAKLIQMSNQILNLIFAVKTVKYLSFQSVPIHIEIYAKRQNNQLPHLCWHCVNSQLYNKYNLKTQSIVSYCFPSFFKLIVTTDNSLQYLFSGRTKRKIAIHENWQIIFTLSIFATLCITCLNFTFYLVEDT